MPDFSKMSDPDQAAYFQRLSSDIEMIRPDLQRLGFKKDNILVLSSEYPDYSVAIDVLYEHLKKPYTDRILETIGRLMAHPSAFRLWRELLAMYQRADKESSEGLMDGLAVALSEHCTRSKSPELRTEIVKLLRDQSRGLSRLYFLHCFRRKRDEESMNLIDELSTDPDLKIEIASWRRKPRTT